MLGVVKNAVWGVTMHMDRHAALYALSLVAIFAVSYKLINLEQHFDVPEYIDKSMRNSWTNCLYVSTMAQSNAMPDYTPKTTAGRIIFMLQVVSGWFWFLMFTGLSSPR